MNVPNELALEIWQQEAICDQFEEAWKTSLSGGTNADPRQSPPSIEQVLATAPSNQRRALAIELLRIEWDCRMALGQQPQWAEYVARTLIGEEELAREFSEWREQHGIVDRVADRFERLEPLGRGAFGVVWKAFDRQLGRLVALKISAAAYAGDAPRFLREAVSASRLSHPNIVRILDAGELESGLFIVREYIAGEPLDRYLQRQRLTSEHSAQITLAMARALEHSHQMSCVHRDIKPQNIIVSNTGVPYLVDFGLAKIDEWANQSTVSGAILGTPMYMAPEQATGDSHRADARTDIYSLGAVLYSMLTRQPPFQGNVPEIMRKIVELDVADPRRLNAQVPADLAAICLKCLEKNPLGRYQSASELVADLQRHLSGQVVLANPISWGQRCGRWLVRNPVPAVLGSVIVLLLVCLTLGSWVFALSLQHSLAQETLLRKAAEDARKTAEVSTAQALADAKFSQEITTFLQNLISQVDPGMLAYSGTPLLGNPQTPAGELLKSATQRLREQPLSDWRVHSRILDTIGNIYRSMGNLAAAEQLLNEAANMRQSQGVGADAVELADDWGEHFLTWGLVKHTRGDYAAAAADYRRARDCFAKKSPDSLQVANIEFQQGWLWLDQREPESARRHFELALSIRQAQLPPQDPAVWVTQVALAQCEPVGERNWQLLASSAERILDNKNIGGLIQQVWQLESARQHRDWSEAILTYENVLQTLDEALPRQHPISILVYGDFCEMLHRAGEYRRAFPLITETMEYAQRIAPHHPKLQDAQAKLAYELYLAGRWEESRQLYAELMAAPAGVPQTIRADVVMHYATVLFHGGQSSAALQCLEQHPNLAPDWNTPFHIWQLHLRWQIQCDLKQDNAAEQTLTQLRRRVDQLVDDPTWSAAVCQRLGLALEELGEYERAESYLRRAVAQETLDRPSDHPRLAERRLQLADFLGRRDPQQHSATSQKEIRLLTQAALAAYRAKLPEDDWRLQGRTEHHGESPVASQSPDETPLPPKQ